MPALFKAAAADEGLYTSERSLRLEADRRSDVQMFHSKMPSLVLFFNYWPLPMLLQCVDPALQGPIALPRLARANVVPTHPGLVKNRIWRRTLLAA